MGHIYDIFGTNGENMVCLDTPEKTDDKNNLEIGTVLCLNGYNDPEYVIIENLGINNKYSFYGAKYKCVNMDNLTFAIYSAYQLKYLSEKKDNRIQVYITDETISINDISSYKEQAEQKEKIKKETQYMTKQEEDTLETIGRQLFKKYIPKDTKALIVAEHEIDDCDLMTDYFNTKTAEIVIIGYSKHTRDIFSEMRKVANKIPETKHLSIAPIINNNGKQKTDVNKSWWTPADEHREKYSMGKGYYLKNSGHYDTGWTISKRNKYNNDWQKDYYISIAKKCVFTEKININKKEKENEQQ